MTRDPFLDDHVGLPDTRRGCLGWIAAVVLGCAVWALLVRCVL